MLFRSNPATFYLRYAPFLVLLNTAHLATLQLLTRDPDSRIGAHGGASEIQAHPFFTSVDWHKCALRQVSPPFKPLVSADEDACDYHDRGRAGDWMFSDGECWQAPSRRTSTTEQKDLDADGLFRDFTFTAKFDKAIEGEDGNDWTSAARRSSWGGQP